MILCLAMILLGGITGFNLYRSYADTLETEKHRLLIQARVVDENLSRQMKGTDQALLAIRNVISGVNTDQRDPDALNQQLKMLEAAIPGVRTLLFADQNGMARFSNREDLLGRDVSSREYFQTPRNHPDPAVLFVSVPFRTVLDAWALDLTRVVLNGNNEFAGIVTATLNPEYFRTMLGSVNYAPDMWSAVAHGDGIQFLMVPERENQAGFNLAHPGSLFSRHMESGNKEDVFTGTVFATGEYRMMVNLSIKPDYLPMDKPLVVAVCREMSVITEPWRKNAWLQSIMFAGIMLLSVAVLAIFQRRRRCYLHELEESYRRIEVLSVTDGLTGIANRRHFDEILAQEYTRHVRIGHELSLIFLDIDHFKAFNDHYGHLGGDDCLKQIAAVLSAAAARPGDLAARYGGEEFACILPETRHGGAAVVAENIRQGILNLAIPHKGSSVADCVTVSMGVVSAICDAGGSPVDIIAAADELLYRAKSSGRNRVEYSRMRPLNGDGPVSLVQLVWKDDYCCGSPVIDSQHRMLFQDTNDLLDAVLAGHPKEAVCSVIDRLMNDVVMHFRDEEIILESVNFAESKEHAAEHAKLLKRGIDLQRGFKTGTTAVGDIFQFLVYELVQQHMLTSDPKFSNQIA